MEQEEEQKRMTRNHDESSELEWISSVWVLEGGSMREREREREQKHNTSSEQKEGKECMHEHVMCKNKDIMGDTQSNPSSTHINNQAHTSNYA